MKKLGHKKFSLALIPLCFIKYPEIENSYFSFIDKIIANQNALYYSFMDNYFNFLYIIPAIIAYFIGVRIPDLDMKLRFLYAKEDRSKLYLYHRQFTHSLLLYLGLLLYIFYEYNQAYMIIPVFLLYGVLNHLVADMLTGSVPWAFYGHYGQRLSRIGITVFLPNFMHELFTRVLVAFLEKNKVVFVILFLINFLFVLEVNFSIYDIIFKI